MFRFAAFSCAIAMACLAGVTHAGQQAPAPTVAPLVDDITTSRPLLVDGDTVYIYSFFSLAERSYTPKVTDQINRQILSMLEVHGIKAHLFVYEKPPPFTFTSAASYGGAPVAVPVKATVDANRENEAAFGARYRMIVVPTGFSSTVYSRFYTIRFLIEDIATGSPVWHYFYQGSHMVIASESENSVARGTKIAAAAYDDLKMKRIIK